MSIIGYMWKGDGDWMAVRPADPNSMVWREWLDRQDASQRKFVKKGTNGDGFWLIAPALVNAVQERFIVSGWVMEYKNPYGGPSGDMSGFVPGAFSGIGPIQNLPKQEALTPYDLLFIKPNAPKCIVDAAYKALMKEVHPDHNAKGHKSSQVLNRVKEQIYAERGW